MTASSQLVRLREALRRQAAGPDVPVETQREQLESAIARMKAPDDVATSQAVADGVPVEWLTPVDASPNRVLLWLHGGGYSIGSLRTVRPLCSNLARATRAVVLSVDYRLAPEHPMPAAVEDAATVYRWLLSRYQPDEIAIGGDSAGGGLTAATLLYLRDRGVPLPCAAVFLSPWADMTMSGDSINHNDDPQFLPGQLEGMADRYLGGQDPAHPFASPALADLRGFPPLAVHVGGCEALRDDSFRLARSAADAGVDVTIECWADVVHVWHAFAPVLPEATAGLERLAEWLSRHWPTVSDVDSDRPGGINQNRSRNEQ